MKIKVLYVSNSASRGGTENHILDLITGLSVLDYEIYLMCPSGELVEEYRKNGAKVLIDFPRFDLDPFYIFRLLKFFKKEKIRIFHAHQLKPVINGLIAAKIAEVPVKIAHIHSPLSRWQVPRIKKYLDILANFVVVNLCADTVLALSEATKRERISGEHIKESKIHVLPNGIDIEKYSWENKQKYSNYLKEKLNLPEDSLIIGTLNRLSIEKGIGIFIEAMPKILEASELRGKMLHFVIAGNGPLRSHLEKLSRKLKIEDKTTFLGFIKEEEKIKVLSGFDVFVFPTLHEGFGLVLGEALSMGIPTVSSDLAVLKEITGAGEAGVHFETASCSDLAKKVVALLISDNKREILKKSGRERIVAKYSLKKFIENYDRFYKDALRI